MFGVVAAGIVIRNGFKQDVEGGIEVQFSNVVFADQSEGSVKVTLEDDMVPFPMFVMWTVLRVHTLHANIENEMCVRGEELC